MIAHRFSHLNSVDSHIYWLTMGFDIPSKNYFYKLQTERGKGLELICAAEHNIYQIDSLTNIETRLSEYGVTLPKDLLAEVEQDGHNALRVQIRNLRWSARSERHYALSQQMNARADSLEAAFSCVLSKGVFG